MGRPDTLLATQAPPECFPPLGILADAPRIVATGGFDHLLRLWDRDKGTLLMGARLEPFSIFTTSYFRAL